MAVNIPTKESLDIDLQYYVNNINDIAVVVYAIIKGNNVPLRMDIESPAQSGLKSLFLNFIDNEIIKNSELTILPLSSADERNNVLYHYDIELPQELVCINTILENENEQEFDFNTHNIDEIKALLICIGNAENNIILYKTMATVNIFSRDSFFLVKSDTRFKEIKQDFFRVSGNFQLIKVNGELYVIDLSLVEKMFGFHDVIKKEASQGIRSIRNMNLISNIDVIQELIDDVKYARKLTRVAKSSPVIQAGINNSSIISFCKSYPT